MNDFLTDRDPGDEGPSGDYTDRELSCRGCFGPCGRCHETPHQPTEDEWRDLGRPAD